MTSDTPRPRLRLLSQGQRRLLLFVIAGAAFMLADSAYLAIAAHVAGVGDHPHVLPVTYQAMLVLHIVAGLVLFVPAVVFALWHLKRALLRRTPGAIPSGISVITVMSFLFVSGFFILTAANSRSNQWAFIGHQITAVLLPLGYWLHRHTSKDRPTRASFLRGLAAMALVLVVAWTAHGLEHLAKKADAPADERPGAAPPAAPYELPAGVAADPFVPFVPAGNVAPESPFFPSSTTTASGGFLPARIIHHDDLPDPEGFARETKEKGFAPSHYLGAQTCVRCHADIVAQWATSAHRFASFNNPFYRKAVELTRDTRGKKTSQWCGGCHDPAIMLAGNMTKEIDPLTPEAQAGLTCLACHSIDAIHDTTGNGNYNVEDEQPSPYVFEYAKTGIGRFVHDYVLKAKPTVHKREMMKPVFRTAEFCATCHKVNLDVPVNGYRWIRGQNDYDAWHNSGMAHNQPMTWYEPPQTKTCQDCHMPPEDAPLGDVAAKGGKVKSHRFLAVNTALPHIRGDEDTIRRTEAFLRDAKLRVDVFAMVDEAGGRTWPLDRARARVRPGSWVEIHVVVRNLGVGHTFPAGTNDSNEGWIDFRASIGGRELWRSGAVQDDGHVDPAAHFYQALLVDKHSQRIARRNPADIHAPVYVNVIPPSGSDIARYRFRVPDDAPEGELTVSADLMWRKFNQGYTEFVFEGKPVPKLPITKIAGAAATLAVARASDDGAPAPAPRAEDWTRFNDYGIGLFLDGETKAALAAFEMVARIAPERVDPWRNQARALIEEGDLARAEEHLRRASEVGKDDPRNAFWWGTLLAESGRLDEAVQAFRRALQVYPDSRDTWSRLGRALWQQGDAAGSIEAFLQVLRIDPEDAMAHHQRSLAYKQLAAKEGDAAKKRWFAFAAGEAEKAFEKYKLDEDAQAVTLGYRLAHPHDNKMAQRIVVHEQAAP